MPVLKNSELLLFMRKFIEILSTLMKRMMVYKV